MSNVEGWGGATGDGASRTDRHAVRLARRPSIRLITGGSKGKLMEASSGDRPAFEPRAASEQHAARVVSGPRAAVAVLALGGMGVALLAAGAFGDVAALAVLGALVIAAAAVAGPGSSWSRPTR